MDKLKHVPYEVTRIMGQDINEVPKGVRLMNAPEIWDKSNRGSGVVIAILGSGCQIDHPDLKERIIGIHNFTSDSNADPNNVDDNYKHGTHLAGIIAASINDQGITGMAPEASLLILKVLSDNGSGEQESIIDAINYAIDWKGPQGEKVRIISMALSAQQNFPAMHHSIIRATDNGILVICGAGNSGGEEKQYPGAYNEVICVGAVDLNKKLTSFSTMNNEVDFVAPGVDIISTYPVNQYATLSGTAMATQFVAGAAALIINQCEKDFGRTLTEDEIYAQLCKRTVTLGYQKMKEGNGFLDLTVGYQSVVNPMTIKTRETVHIQ